MKELAQKSRGMRDSVTYVEIPFSRRFKHIPDMTESIFIDKDFRSMTYDGETYRFTFGDIFSFKRVFSRVTFTIQCLRYTIRPNSIRMRAWYCCSISERERIMND